MNEKSQNLIPLRWGEPFLLLRKSRLGPYRPHDPIEG